MVIPIWRICACVWSIMSKRPVVAIRLRWRFQICRKKTYRADAVELADHVLTVNIADAQTRSILRLQADGSLKELFVEGYDFELLLTRTPVVVFKRPQTPKEPFLIIRKRWLFRMRMMESPWREHWLGQPVEPGARPWCWFPAVAVRIAITLFRAQNFFVLADYLARHGIATLRVDDRGVGKSGGNLKESGLPDADADAVAAVNYLKQRPEINADSVGVIGHSEGAFVAFSMAARKEVPLSSLWRAEA